MILFNNKVPSDVKYHAQSHKNVSYRFKRCSFASTDWARRFESCGLLGVDVCVRSIVAFALRSLALLAMTCSAAVASHVRCATRRRKAMASPVRLAEIECRKTLGYAFGQRYR
jgi:hypothetical protein